MATDQFDNFQLNPNDLGSDWVFSGDEAVSNAAPNSAISNYNLHFVGKKMSTDRTRTTLGGPSDNINPSRTIGDGFVGWGVDWALFNYNPYSKTNPNFKVHNDWLKITGLGGITIPVNDVMGIKESWPSGMVQYRNYPTEGYNSFGKTTGGASPDKEWAWHGNTWVPA